MLWGQGWGRGGMFQRRCNTNGTSKHLHCGEGLAGVAQIVESTGWLYSSRVVFSNDGRDYEIDFVSMKQGAFMRVGTEGRVRRVVLHGDLLAPSQSTAQISGTTFHVASPVSVAQATLSHSVKS